MKILIASLAAAASIAAGARAQDSTAGKELDRANAQYTLQRADMITKLDTVTIAGLETLKAQYMRAGNLPKANQVQSKIDELKTEISDLAASATPPLGAATRAPSQPPAASTGAAAPSDPTGAAVHALVSGSRWEWFDSLDFTGKASWQEFYRDGTGRTSWGRSPTWEVLPPNVLHIFDPADKREWYLDVDVGKRVATKSGEKDRNRNSMKYEKRVPTPPASTRKK